MRSNDKVKVIIVMGSTGSGKSKLSIELATRFNGEIINSDKIQVHRGLDIITNKVTVEECRGVPHHLLGIVDPDVDFTASDFCRHVNLAVDSITEKGKVAVIAGGSNSYLEELVNNDSHFKKYEPLFLWVYVSMPVLEKFVSDRVDQMVQTGAVEEVREIFEPESADYTKGIRKAIGVPEFDRFFKAEMTGEADVETLDLLLKESIDQVKKNTFELACKQREKIQALQDNSGWELNRIDATEVFEKRGKPGWAEVWEKVVVVPSVKLVDRFLSGSVELDGEEHLPTEIPGSPLEMHVSSKI
ncbi:uncharacterized protein [Phyllobates terribilis]|uniref:uncharacterized protein n=1 Tax=Phyllobates terribilis TaxID=111132 RepID=UPI003CCB1158